MNRMLLGLSVVLLAAGVLQAQPRVRPVKFNDTNFVRQVGNNAQFNIELANAFVTHTPNRELREVALRNAVDQNAMRVHMGNAARYSNMSVIPVGMSLEQRRQLNELKSLKDAEFDAAYLKQAAKANQASVAEFQRAVNEAS